MSPRRKKAESKKTTKKDQSLTDRIQSLNITKSYTSLAYGVVTVVVLFILVVVGIRTFTQQEDVDITDDAALTQQGSEYTVQAGQTLWDISEEVYGTGFEWERIAQANDLDNPGQIEEGMTLAIPQLDEEDDLAMEATPEAEDEEEDTEVEEEEPTEAPTSTPSPTTRPQASPSPTTQPQVGGEAVEGSTYTVAEGDYLWDIAVRAYGDGFRWVEIYRANVDAIDNPDLIFPDQELTIPRDN